MVIYTKIFSMYYIFISLRDVNILLGTKMIIESRGKNNISGKTLYRNRIHDVIFVYCVYCVHLGLVHDMCSIWVFYVNIYLLNLTNIIELQLRN